LQRLDQALDVFGDDQILEEKFVSLSEQNTQLKLKKMKS